MLAAGVDDVDDVRDEHRLDVNPFDGGTYRVELGRVGDLADHDLVGAAREPAGDHLDLVADCRVSEVGADDEPVELRLRQGIGALGLHGVLGGDHEERVRQPVGGAIDRDLELLHRLEQRGLGLGRCPVDLVGEHELGEHRAATERRVTGVHVDHGRPRDVARQHVGRELDAGEAEAGRRGDRPRGKGLGDSWDVVEQHMSTGEQGGNDEFQLLLACRPRRVRPRR